MCSLTPPCVNIQPVFATDAPFVLKMCSWTPLCVNIQPVFATDAPFVLKMCSLKDKSKVRVIFDTTSIKAHWERWCRWNCDLRVINAWKKALSVIPKASPWRPNHVTIYAYYITLGSRCKMANSSSEDKTDTLPERPTRIQPYQFEPARQDFEGVPVFHGVCEIALTEVLAI